MYTLKQLNNDLKKDKREKESAFMSESLDLSNCFTDFDPIWGMAIIREHETGLQEVLVTLYVPIYL